MFTRRSFVAMGAATALGACTTDTVTRNAPLEPVIPPLPAFYGPIMDEPFPIPAVPEGVVPPPGRAGARVVAIIIHVLISKIHPERPVICLPEPDHSSVPRAAICVQLY